LSVSGPSNEVIIVGGGAGGAELATALGRRFGGSTMNVTLVDLATNHLWKPRLHELAAGLIGAGEDETSYLALARANGFRFRLGALTALDPVNRTITISAVTDSEGNAFLDERQLRYDTLILAFGSQVNDFGVPGVAEHCHMLDSGAQALAFQRRVLEQSVRVADGMLEKLRVGIVGAGATGVELAAELHHAIGAMHRFGGLMPVSDLEITVVDMAARVLPGCKPATSEFAGKMLDRLGVNVRLNTSVQEVTAEGLVLKDGSFIPCGLKVWASGIIGRPIAARLTGLQVDRSRRIVCDDHLRCEGLEGVYALGDCASIRDPETQRPLPATAQVAHQQASYLARALRPGSHSDVGPFKYHPRGSLVSFGEEPTAGEIPVTSRSQLIFGGRLPKLLYVSLQLMHRAALIGWARAMALIVADRLQRKLAPPVKLH
jgi:NADH:ubiquinone reductase (H+-translocating)